MKTLLVELRVIDLSMGLSKYRLEAFSGNLYLDGLTINVEDSTSTI